MSQENGKKRAVIYARYSSHNQSQESAEAQIRACEVYAEKHNMIVLYVYQDLEISGKSMENRDELKKLLRDSEKGLFDVVLAHKLDRIGRNLEDYLKNDSILEENNVELVALDSPFPNDANGKFFKQLLMLVNERFIKNLSNEISFKSKEYARKGYFLGGIPPYGYDVFKFLDEHGKERKKLQVNHGEADVIKFIFDEYIKGTNIKKIINELATKGIKTKQNKTFNGDFVRKIISNDVYIGTYSHAKRSRQKDAEVIIIEDCHEAIIDKETFAKAQQIKKTAIHNARQRFDQNERPKEKYILTGLMKCGCCDSQISAKGGNRLYRYYQCSSISNKHEGYCTNRKSINKDSIESTILNLVVERMFTEENIKLYSQLIVDNLTQNHNTQKEIDQVKKEKAKVVSKFSRVEDSYFDNLISKERFISLKNEHELLLEEFDKKLFELEIANLPVDKKMIDKYLLSIKNDIKKLDSESQNLILKSIIDKIVVSETDIDVYFKVFSPYSPSEDMGDNYIHICGKETHGLASKSLSQKGISLYRLKNGIYLSHVHLFR